MNPTYQRRARQAEPELEPSAIEARLDDLEGRFNALALRLTRLDLRLADLKGPPAPKRTTTKRT